MIWQETKVYIKANVLSAGNCLLMGVVLRALLCWLPI